ncbi:MAG: hypothetical protein ACXQTV_04015 [Candidatus Hecatellaceae archaeon]
MLQLNHYGLADVAILHGALTLITGFILLALRLGWVRLGVKAAGPLRLIHVALGVLTAFYGLAVYLTPP